MRRRTTRSYRPGGVPGRRGTRRDHDGRCTSSSTHSRETSTVLFRAQSPENSSKTTIALVSRLVFASGWLRNQRICELAWQAFSQFILYLISSPRRVPLFRSSNPSTRTFLHLQVSAIPSDVFRERRKLNTAASYAAETGAVPFVVTGASIRRIRGLDTRAGSGTMFRQVRFERCSIEAANYCRSRVSRDSTRGHVQPASSK